MTDYVLSDIVKGNEMQGVIAARRLEYLTLTKKPFE